MQRSETISELAKALSKAQGAIENASKDADNPFFHSKYADLASVRAAIREALAANGLSCAQFPTTRLTEIHETREDKDGRPFEAYLTLVSIETTLFHSSGEFVSSALELPVWDADPQKVGSAITYGRRYGLQSVAGVAAEIDDDGNAASGRNRGPQPSAPRQNGPMREPPKPAPRPQAAPAPQAKQAPATRAAEPKEAPKAPEAPASASESPKPASVQPLGISDGEAREADRRRAESRVEHEPDAKPSQAIRSEIRAYCVKLKLTGAQAEQLCQRSAGVNSGQLTQAGAVKLLEVLRQKAGE